MGLIKKIKKRAGMSIKTSVRGDLNSIASKLFGGFGNKFDNRISDAFSDLLTGVTGVRTSNIPDIGGEVNAAKQNRRAERIAAVEDYDKNTARETPPGSQILAFPRKYFNQKGGPATVASTGVGNKDRGAFPNSIHFRSLKRKKFDASEGGVGEGQETTGKAEGVDGTASDVHNDRGAWGSVDPRVEPIYDIFLYLPHQLGDAVKLSYSNDNEAGIMESMFAKLFSFGDTDDAVKENVGANNTDFGEMLQVLKDKLPGGKIVQQATGALVNPMKFQLFTGVEMRSYSYKFTLIPSTPNEALEIKKIIAAFKLSSLPGIAGENGRIWTQPNEWAIRFRGPVANWLDFPLTVACTGVEVDYSSGGTYTLMEDGSPAAIDLTVHFAETTQLNRQKYAKQVSALTGAGRDMAAAERGTKIVDQEIHRNDGHTVNWTQEQLDARNKKQGNTGD